MMHFLSMLCRRGCLRSFLVLLIVINAASFTLIVDAAEPVRLWKATSARLYLVRGAERRLLDRAEQYLADEQWDDALTALQRLLESDETRVVAFDQHRYVSLRYACQCLLLRLPEQQRIQYRSLVDPVAESWYREAIRTRDTQLLQRLIDHYFFSSWADDALLVWGELALQSGDYQTARRAWLRLRPELDRDHQRLTYADADTSLAEVRARLTLVSIREGSWQRAENELNELQQEHPTATGQLGGREVIFAEHLAALLRQARDWPAQLAPTSASTFGVTAQRTNHVATTEFNPPPKLLWSESLTENDLQTYPVATAKWILYQDEAAVHARNVSNGSLAYSATGDSFQSPPQSTGYLGRAQYTLAAYDDLVFGVTPTLLGPRRRPVGTNTESLLWAINTRRDGALALRISGGDPKLSFSGAPTIVEHRCYVPVRANDQTARVGLACYDLDTKEQVWLRWLVQANTPATGWTNEVASNLLAFDAGVFYVNTNLGALAAVHAMDGTVLWLRVYDRHSAELTGKGKSPYYAGPNPCVAFRGRVFVRPSDSDLLQALDAATGAQLWQANLADPEARLMGVAKGRVIVADQGLKIFDAQSGEILARQAMPDLIGQPILIGQRVAWPTEKEIVCVDFVDGETDAITLELPQPGGAILSFAEGRLIAAGPTHLSVFQFSSQ